MSKNQPANKKRVLEHLAESPIIEAACRKAGIGRSTFYDWRNKDGEFNKACKEAIKKGTERISDLAESQLIKLIQDGDRQSIMFWLNNRNENYALPNKLVREVYKEVHTERAIPIMPIMGGMSRPEIREKLEKKWAEVVEETLIEHRDSAKIKNETKKRSRAK